MSIKYSVIIPTSSNFNHLAETLAYVKDGSDAEETEIIVVNNASVDTTEEYLKTSPEIISIHNTENLGFGKAVNMGIKIAKGEWVVILNDDALVPHNFLKKFSADCKEYERISGTKPASIAAPTSNYVGMNIQQEKCRDRESFEITAKRLYRIMFICK